MKRSVFRHTPETIADAMWARVRFGHGPDSCWLWVGAITGKGYGRFHPTRRINIPAHRAVFEATQCAVHDGLVLDHLCRNRACVNPAHLEVVTGPENVARGEGPTAVNGRKTHCMRGHEFTPENTGSIPSGRYCRECKRAAAASARERDPDAHRTYQREWARRKRARLRAAGLTSTGTTMLHPEKSDAMRAARRRKSWGRV